MANLAPLNLQIVNPSGHGTMGSGNGGGPPMDHDYATKTELQMLSSKMELNFHALNDRFKSLEARLDERTKSSDAQFQAQIARSDAKAYQAKFDAHMARMDADDKAYQEKFDAQQKAMTDEFKAQAEVAKANLKAQMAQIKANEKAALANLDRIDQVAKERNEAIAKQFAWINKLLYVLIGMAGSVWISGVIWFVKYIFTH